MKRRTLLAGMGAAAVATRLSAPALAQSEKSRVLKMAPQTSLLVLDPSTTTITPSNNHGYCIFDQLYAVDSLARARPQMALGHTISDDKLTWDIKLRPGLKFHDGEKVLAKDCVASIKRWWVRDAFGGTLRAYTDEVLAADDDTLRFRLKKPFGILPDALAHPLAAPLFIMPERLADPDPAKPLTELIGSGPLKWIASEFVPSQHAAYAKNAAYVPRDEKPDGAAGGKIMYFDRLEWNTIADFATAAAALQAGEIDWWDVAQFDMLELLRANKDITVTTADPGFLVLARFNCGIAPFNNPALRRIVAQAVNQIDITQAIVGADPSLQYECYSMYSCALAGHEQVGKSIMNSGKKDYKALADAVKKAGYNGEKIVLFRVTDNALTSPISPVMMDVLQKIGFNVEMQSMDLNTMGSRRMSQAPVEQGGWSMFITQTGSAVSANPVVDVILRGQGLKGFPGNYNDPELESMIGDWIAITDIAARDAQTTKIQEHLFQTMPIVPLGGFKSQTAFRSDLTGYLPGQATVPWNIRRV
jgi:peptide/nickel transport system substrate-binding protein